MQITCQDAVDGHSVTRTLAYALLDSIMRRDGDKKWLTFMREKGYLKQVISSLLLEDGVLVESLQGNGNLASVYVHESRMSLLSTLARHRVGARALVETGIIQQLSDAKFLDMRPVVSNMGDGQGNEEKIHRSVSLPTLFLNASLPCLAADYVPSKHTRYSFACFLLLTRFQALETTTSSDMCSTLCTNTSTRSPM